MKLAMKWRTQLVSAHAIAAAGVGLVLLFLTSGADIHAQAKVDFSKDIEPIFQKSCYSCHGAKVQMSGLRLDAKKAVLAGGLSGRIIVPGKSAESSLYQRVAGIGEQVRMPVGGKLEPAEIALIQAWIDQGAVWPDGPGVEIGETRKHWAFLPPERPALPKIIANSWPANPIDYFILSRLEKESLRPSPPADRVVLLRRLSLDLTGLPPAITEVDAFLNDKSRNAYEKQVDRLLASPHYGERWGRHWLDAARYSDSNGFEKDRPRQVWSYRDWVIHAFNRNLPYDQFIVEQLAGDLLPNATQDQTVATGFLRNSMVNEEGGVDPEQFRMESMFDRMEAIGKGILGVTIQCAQCHNHKFDPLKQEEYYRMVAFINNTQEASVPVYSPAEESKRAQIFRKIHEIESGLQNGAPDWKQRLAAWEETIKEGQPDWVVVRPEVDDISTGGQKYIAQADGSLLAGGYAPTKLRLKLTAKTEVQNITAMRLELLTDADLPLGGPGRSAKGTCALTQIDVEAAPSNAPKQVAKVKIAKATSDYNPVETVLDQMYQDKPAEKVIEQFAGRAGEKPDGKPSGKPKKPHVIGPVEFAIDDKDDTAWGTEAGPVLRNQSRKAVFTFEAPVSNAGGTLLTVYLKQSHGGSNPDESENNNIGRFRLSITTAPGAAADPVPQNVRQILAIPRTRRSPMQAATVFSYWRTLVPEWRDANQQIADLWKQHPEGTSQLVLAARENPRSTHILTRGDFLKPAKEVGPGVPEFLNPLPAKAPLNRIAFAKWMVDRKAPTTARSFVNRMWQAYFGTGLVATPENFGTQSEPPSHPELLDWLAVEFMDRGWNIKAMHRLIVTSATYRQSSNATEELYARDPYNRLLARGPRFRVEGEVVRDIALAASGLLNPRIGGPSVFPPAPAFLFVPPASYSAKSWKESTGADRYRRALYTFRYRSVPYPVLQTFDAPNGDSSCVRRARSNTPLQALATLNETLFVESARALALRTLQEGGKNDDERITYAFRRCISRKPTEAESAELRSLLHLATQRFAGGELNPLDLVADDPARPPALPNGTTPVQAAAWTSLARVLLNLDETITKE